MSQSGVTTFIDNFNRAQSFTTTPGFNGWTIADTSSAGTPTYLCVTEDGGAAALTLESTNEVQNVCLYQNDVLPYDVRLLDQVWYIAKVGSIASSTTLVMGVGSARNDTPDTVTANAWFRIEGGTSTSNLLAETDDNVTDSDDKSTGTTLSSTYKKLLIDFSQGLSYVRFFVDGALVRTLSMSGLAAGQNVQPIVQIQKTAATSTPSVQIAQFGCTYKWTY